MKNLLTCLSLLISTTLSAQTLSWAKAATGNDQGRGTAIAVDHVGNVFTTGSFEDTVDFDPGETIYNLITNPEKKDAFVYKLNADGEFEWVKQIGAEGHDRGYAIGCDNEGNVYVAGNFHDTVDFDPGEDVFNMYSSSERGLFILKLDTDGDFVWAKSIVDGTVLVHDMKIDEDGNSYMTGYFYHPTDFDPGEGVHTLDPGDYASTYILKLDKDGELVWCDNATGTGENRGYGLDFDAFHNVYVTGSFGVSASFNIGSGSTTLTANGFLDTYVIKIDSEGDLLWAKGFGGEDEEVGYGIAVDNTEGIYLTGKFESEVDFDPGEGTFLVEAMGERDAFVQKLDWDGNFIWVKTIESNHTESGYCVAIDGFGDLYIAGYYSHNSTDFDPGEDEYMIGGSSGGFILKLNKDGEFRWVFKPGGIPVEFTTSFMTVDHLGTIYSTGRFTDTPDFDPGDGFFHMEASGVADIFVQKLIGIPLGIESNHNDKLQVYPNPVTNTLFLQLESQEKLTFILYGIDGRKVIEVLAEQGQAIDVSLLKSGVYIYEVIGQGKSYETGKVIIAK